MYAKFVELPYRMSKYKIIISLTVHVLMNYFLRHETDDPENVCVACHKELPEWVPVKVCRTCTCHNLDIATICRACLTPFGPNQHAELVKLCPFCNHDNSDGLDCYNCLYKNVVPTSYCIQCGMPLRDLEDMEVDAPDQSVVSCSF